MGQLSSSSRASSAGVGWWPINVDVALQHSVTYRPILIYKYRMRYQRVRYHCSPEGKGVVGSNRCVKKVRRGRDLSIEKDASGRSSQNFAANLCPVRDSVRVDRCVVGPDRRHDGPSPRRRRRHETKAGFDLHARQGHGLGRTKPEKPLCLLGLESCYPLHVLSRTATKTDLQQSRSPCRAIPTLQGSYSLGDTLPLVTTWLLTRFLVFLVAQNVGNIQKCACGCGCHGEEMT